MFEAITSYVGKLSSSVKLERVEKNEVLNLHLPVYAYTDAYREFYEDLQPFLVEDYDKTVKDIRIKLGTSSINEDIDISTLTAHDIQALITYIIRKNRFCSGLLAYCLQSGTIEKWLMRLKEIDEEK
ncbi:MAG: hypothetical protein IJC83_04965 [Oscillospiraceae bacterium]|nr:hypothetical protein [Oscillospiraceae bacterium]